MIRRLQSKDMDVACDIVNDNWKSVYAGYVNEELLGEKGCADRKERLKKDFLSGRLENYIDEQDHQVVALLSIGPSEDPDKAGSFEVWRIYLKKEFQRQRIGSDFIHFAEAQARKEGFHEIVIWAFQKNTSALAFYQKNGYRVDQTNYLGKPFFAYALRLQKTLL